MMLMLIENVMVGLVAFITSALFNPRDVLNGINQQEEIYWD